LQRVRGERKGARDDAREGKVLQRMIKEIRPAE
jgi:hypothetical protein